MNIAKIINDHIKKRGITIYYLSKSTGISYELLRRSFNENRELRADELIKIAVVLDYDLNVLKFKNL